MLPNQGGEKMETPNSYVYRSCPIKSQLVTKEMSCISINFGMSYHSLLIMKSGYAVKNDYPDGIHFFHRSAIDRLFLIPLS